MSYISGQKRLYGASVTANGKLKTMLRNLQRTTARLEDAGASGAVNAKALIAQAAIEDLRVQVQADITA